ncbi:MAG: DUF2059 domain-containing protein [Gammaproteobacteria bacterium]|nr:DUF2059 domain-containing protein [Gammaproteobacteria bacterium]
MSDKSKKILVVQYSQTGQLSRLVSSVVEPLDESSFVDVTYATVEPQKAYPFPWPFFRFFDVFPESVYLDAPPIKEISLDPESKFDLVILAYQVWFLSPSLPITAFVKSDIGKKVLRDTPVITVIGCRNMWAMAQETMKKMLVGVQAKLIDNIVLVDQGSSLASFVTTVRWLLTGKKSAFGGFPEAGIAEKEIKKAVRFGSAIKSGLMSDMEKTGLPLLKGLRAVEVDVSLVQSEKIGYRSFRIWGKLLRSIGPQGDVKRKPVLVIYITFLLLMIVTVVPVTMLLKRIFSPFLRQRYQSLKTTYEQPSGSGSERMGEF